MDNNLLYIMAALFIGGVIAWLWAKNNASGYYNKILLQEKDRYNALENQHIQQKSELNSLLLAAKEKGETWQHDYNEQKTELHKLEESLQLIGSQLATANAQSAAVRSSLQERISELDHTKESLAQLRDDRDKLTNQLATALAENKALQEKQESLQADLEKLNQKFLTEFENVANKILETKTEKFTALNRDNLTHILQPLGEKIQDFKKQVEDCYGKESNERASLKTEVKSLIDMNQQLASEAKNLTRALKAEVKTQGRWGEMILEKILDKSGLRKGEEFFMEYQLFGTDGKALQSAVSGKKMRPDALLKYPDNRHVIIDSKVSLNAFIRMVEAEEEAVQQAELLAHVKAVKNHIDELSVKAYDDYDKSMDFVMMFVPNEAAYFATMQGDSNIWEYAYDRRILLISPTNLIAALKLISDLWKRERNDKNAMAIADRAVKMYEKLVGFVDSLEAVGKNLDLAKDRYEEAVNKLHSGRDNFFGQAGKMKLLLNYQKQKDFPEAKLDLGEQHDAAAIKEGDGRERLNGTG